MKTIATKGWIRLPGQLKVQDQRLEADKVARDLRSVKRVVNCTTLKPAASSPQVPQMIERALENHAAFQAQHIVLELKDSVVTLLKCAQSHQERNDAAFALWAVAVDSKAGNFLSVQP